MEIQTAIADEHRTAVLTFSEAKALLSGIVTVNEAERNYSPSQIEAIARFAFLGPNANVQSEALVEFPLTDPTVAVVLKTANLVHLDQRRKATGDPYLKHVLRVAKHVFDQHKTEFGQERYMNELILALLHDTVESTKPEDRPLFFESMRELLISHDLDSDRTTKLLDNLRLLTPEDKAPQMSASEWLEVKTADFNHLITEGDAAVVNVKLADCLANMEETWEDLKLNLANNKVGNGGTEASTKFRFGIAERLEMFAQRLALVRKHQGSHILLPQLEDTFSQMQIAHREAN